MGMSRDSVKSIAINSMYRYRTRITISLENIDIQLLIERTKSARL